MPDRTSVANSCLLAAAEREMCAFLRAVNSTFDRSALQRAADLWIAAFETLDDEEIERDQDFHRITIRAAAALAAEASPTSTSGLHAVS
jgi:hypothetical protein